MLEGGGGKTEDGDITSESMAAACHTCGHYATETGKNERRNLHAHWDKAARKTDKILAMDKGLCLFIISPQD